MTQLLTFIVLIVHDEYKFKWAFSAKKIVCLPAVRGEMKFLLVCAAEVFFKMSNKLLSKQEKETT